MNGHRADLYLIAIFLLVVAAWRFGQGPERWMAATLLAMQLSTLAYLEALDRKPLRAEVEPGLFIIEVVVTVILVTVALRANRMYTLWIAGFQIIALIAHFARGLADHITPIAYVMMYVGPSYLQIITLAFGIWLHHQRELYHGSYRSWRSSSPRSQAMPPTN